MASIRKCGNTWQARVTRYGYPTETKPFAIKAGAERSARSIKAEMDRGKFINRSVAEQTTVGDVPKHYAETVTPTKRGGTEETTG